MIYRCVKCEQLFNNEHDVSMYYDQDTNLPRYACHDCQIISAQSRRWLLKAHIKSKTQAIEKKLLGE